MSNASEQTPAEQLPVAPTPEKKKFEIERKFLVKFIPGILSSYHHEEIIQGYYDDERGKSMRVRRSQGVETKYYRTYKEGSGIKRREDEISITEEEFNNLWSKVQDRIVTKTRYYVPIANELTAELDVYHDRHGGLLTVEVEFLKKKEAKKLVPPEWFGEEVTKDKKYSNRSLAVNGLPE